MEVEATPFEVRCYLLGRGVDATALKSDVDAKSRLTLVQAAALPFAGSEDYVEMIVAQTLRARASGTLLAHKPEIDLLLRLSGGAQISAAISAVGAKKGRRNALILVGESAEIQEAERRESLSELRIGRRPLSSEELLRIEDAALLDSVRA
jgi:tRNA threonylcarbamoyladenosine modification (KEOPS) complex Cgi121 subunit